jgi:probable DNA metabolism protein
MQARLSSETDLAGFREEARSLLAHQVPPEAVEWETSPAQNGDLFADAVQSGDLRPRGVPKAATAIVPASFMRLCELVVLHSEPQRFALLYRLLWRLVHEPGLRNDPIDADMLHAQQMAQAVRRDMHKMKAFLRFRQVPDETHPGEVLHVAWFEPTHHIVEAVAPWFAKRFANMRWAILTPERCVEYDPHAPHSVSSLPPEGAPLALGRPGGEYDPHAPHSVSSLPPEGASLALGRPGGEGVAGRLRYGPGAQRGDAPHPDAGEALWLTYYRSIFNPARLKLQAMRKEMPRKYWNNLPEAQLISPLAAQAMERSGTMIEQPATQPLRRIPKPAHAGHPQETLARDGIGSLEELKLATMRCRECPIGEYATQSVTGEGRLHAPLMFVGEQPGDQEDLQGHPFIGPAGQLLDRALAAVDIPRDAVFVSNAVKHFKYELRGKRRIHKSPTQREAAACLHWLEDEIALVQPRALVALGATAARSLMGRVVGVTSERGQWLERADGLRVLITLHPSALLRMPAEEREAAFEAFVADLSQAREFIDAQH